MIFVLLLHVNSATIILKGLEAYSDASRFVYYLTEATAYPAIHLFVLIGSYFMIEHGTRIKSIVNIWLQTIITTVAGLAILLVTEPNAVSIGGLLQSLFPFLLKAYWFVSIYLILMLISPFLRKFANLLADKWLFLFTAMICVVCIVFPSFLSAVDWTAQGDLGLFVCLFFIAACFHRQKPNAKKRKLFLLCSVVSIALMVLSVYMIGYVGNHISILRGKEQIFYRYSSVFVVTSAVGLFGYFATFQQRGSIIQQFCGKAARYSLVVYLVHMHPIIKQFYTEWRIVDYMATKSALLYSLQLVGTCLVVGVVCSGIGFFVLRLADYLTTKAVPILKRNQFLCALYEPTESGK